MQGLWIEMLLQADPPNRFSQMIGGHTAVETKGREFLLGDGRKVEIRQSMFQVGALTTFFENGHQRCPAWAVQKLNTIREITLACNAAQQCFLILDNQKLATLSISDEFCAYLAQNVRAMDEAKQVKIGNNVQLGGCI
jgi:hypothetical protein